MRYDFILHNSYYTSSEEDVKRRVKSHPHPKRGEDSPICYVADVVVDVDVVVVVLVVVDVVVLVVVVVVVLVVVDVVVPNAVNDVHNQPPVVKKIQNLLLVVSIYWSPCTGARPS